MTGGPGEPRDHVKAVSEAPLADGDQGDAHRQQHHNEASPDAVADIPEHVDTYEDGSDDPRRDTEEERRFRMFGRKHDEHDRSEQSESHLGSGGEVADNGHEHRRSDGDRNDESGEPDPADHLLNDVTEIPKEEQGDQNPRAGGRIGEGPGRKTPDLAASNGTRPKHQSREQVNAERVDEHRQDPRADEEGGCGDVDASQAEPPITGSALGHPEVESLGHTTTVPALVSSA